MDVSRIRQQIGVLSKERLRLERELLAIRQSMVKGSLSERFLPCGNAKADCRCRHGQRHGPFYYMSVFEHGKKIHKYLGTTDDTPLAKGLLRYKAFQERMRQMHKLDSELASLWDRYREGLLEKRG